MRGSGRRDMKELHQQAQQLQAQQRQPADWLGEVPGLHLKGGRPSSRGSDLGGVDGLGDSPASRAHTTQGGGRRTGAPSLKGSTHQGHGPPPGSPYGHTNGGNMLRPSPALYGGGVGNPAGFGGAHSPAAAAAGYPSPAPAGGRWPTGPTRGGPEQARDTPSRQGNRRHEGQHQARDMPPLHPVHHGPGGGGARGELGLSRELNDAMDNFMGGPPTAGARTRNRDLSPDATEAAGFKSSPFYVAPVPTFEKGPGRFGGAGGGFGGPDSRPASREAHSRAAGGSGTGRQQMDSMGFAYHNFGGTKAPAKGRRN